MSVKGQAQGQKAALSPESVAAIRAHLAARGTPRDRALFALAIDSMLRGADVLKLRIRDLVGTDGKVCETITVQQGKVSGKASRPVTCYLTQPTREAVASYIATLAGRTPDAFAFCGYGRAQPMTTQNLRLCVKAWVGAVNLDPSKHAAHTLRRTKATAIYRSTKDLELVRVSLGHAQITSTQAYISVGADEVRRACLSVAL